MYWKFYKMKRQLQRRWVPWGGKKLKLCKLCMEGTRSDILQAIETEVKNTGGHNVIWIRGSPGVKKSALAASISTQLQDQNRHVSKIIWNFPRLLKGVGTSRVGEEEGIYIIHFCHSYNSCDIQLLFTSTYVASWNCSTWSWKIAYKGIYL